MVKIMYSSLGLDIGGEISLALDPYISCLADILSNKQSFITLIKSSSLEIKFKSRTMSPFMLT